MAIRGPQGPRPDAPAPREQPQSPTQRLIDFGSAKTPQEAVKLLKEILTLLAAAGFPLAPPSKKGDDSAGHSSQQRMQPALKQLQKENGLPQTGQLDKQTLSLLEKLGLLPKNAAAESLDQKTTKAAQTETQFTLGGPRLGAEKGAPRANAEVPAGTSKTRAVETEAAKARADNNKVEVQVDLKQMLNALKSAGFAGVGKGKEQLQDAVKKLQRVDGLPVTGQLDANTAAALEKRGVIDASTSQALKEQDPTYTQSPSSSSVAEGEKARGDDVTGKGGPAGDGAGKGVGGGAGSGHADADGVGDVAGEDDDAYGNNYAGDDDDDDDDRGEANVDADDADDALQHWEAKKLAVQVEEALAAVVRDDDGAGAATYGWELRLHRPGVYGRKQPAEELLHLVVKNAGPFDPVWQQAVDGINVRLRRYEPDAAPLEMAQLKLALQRARYRTAPD